MSLPQGYWDETNGYIQVTQSKTGLSANTNYNVRLVARKTSTTNTRTVGFTGTAQAIGK